MLFSNYTSVVVILKGSEQLKEGINIYLYRQTNRCTNSRKDKVTEIKADVEVESRITPLAVRIKNCKELFTTGCNQFMFIRPYQCVQGAIGVSRTTCSAIIWIVSRELVLQAVRHNVFCQSSPHPRARPSPQSKPLFMAGTPGQS